MDARIAAALEAAVGAKVTGARAVGGGDINRADAVTLADGRRLFVKWNAREPAGMCSAGGPTWKVTSATERSSRTLGRLR